MRSVKSAGPVLAIVACLGVAPPTAIGQTITDALVQAYNTSPDLAAARAQLRATDEDVAIAMSGWRPTVSFSANVGEAWRRTNGNATAPAEQRLHIEPRGESITLSQSLYRGGRTVASTRQADYSVLADRANLLDTEQSVLLAAATAYVDVVRDQSTLELNVNNERVLQRQLQATRDRFQVGEVTRTDVSQAESRLAAATASRIASEGTLATSRATYLRVVGTAPGRLVAPPPIDGLPSSLSEANAQASQNSFPVVGALNTERAARENVDVIFGELLPNVSLNGSFVDSRGQQTVLGRSKQATVSVTATVPLYEGGSVMARTRQAKETAMQRRKELDTEIRTAIQSSSPAWEALQTARAQVTSFDAQVKAAQIALEGVRQEQEVGSRTVLDVLDAEQELLNAQVSLVNAQRNVVVQSYTLRSSVATLTAAQLKLPVDFYDHEKHYKDTRYRWFGLSTDGDDEYKARERELQGGDRR
jgi:TolC family type I secretion outer membrane protein